MSNWISRVHELSVEQLEELIRELGPIAVLQKEFNAKVLMRRVKGLSRALALMLIGCRVDQVRAAQVKQLAEVLTKNRFTEAELTNLLSFCNEGGAVLLQRAIARYLKDPITDGANRAVQELLGNAGERQKKKGDQFTADDAQRGLEADLEDFGEDAAKFRLREILRDDYGIESKEDFLMLLQAMKMIEQTQAEMISRGGLRERNKAVRMARALYEKAKAQGSTPKAIIEWDKLKRTKLNPNVIYTRPDGQQIWGNGEAVIRDKDGNPRRKAFTIFGTEVPTSEVPDMNDIGRDVRKAYPDETPKKNQGDNT